VRLVADTVPADLDERFPSRSAQVFTRDDLVNPSLNAAAPDLMATLAAFAGGRYSLLRMIGAGAEKMVFLVYDTALDRECALGLLRSGDVSRDTAERFRTEARAIARLGSHSHIVTVFDAGTHEGAHFFVSEHLAGGDLAIPLRDAGGHMPVARVADIARQILRALAFIHERGIIQRDLKAAKIWLTAAGGTDGQCLRRKLSLRESL